jgi:hypothetical protein
MRIPILTNLYVTFSEAAGLPAVWRKTESKGWNRGKPLLKQPRPRSVAKNCSCEPKLLHKGADAPCRGTCDCHG